MAEIPVTITGVICDLYGRTITGPVKIVGSMVRSGLSVGGGPIIPPDGSPGGPGGSPPGIWPGPGDPDFPGGGGPPGTWPPQRPPHPAHPIVLPTPPTEPPPVDPPTQPPSDNWVWGFVPDGSGGGVWKPVFVPEGGGKPQPIP